MKAGKIIFILLAVGLLAIGVNITSYAFHAGGVAECGGCHSMHSPAPLSDSLLIKQYTSSVCLSCHGKPANEPGSYHIETVPDPGAGLPPVNYTPGGDFGWLMKTYDFVVRGEAINEPGQTHGHNVVAPDYGIGADTTNTTAPGGGTFSASNLACISCHDPHGKYRRNSGGIYLTDGKPIAASGSTGTIPGTDNAVGSFRLLAGLNYSNNSPNSLAKVNYPGVPVAVAPSTYNLSENTNQVKVAYGVGATAQNSTTWGNWCAACHPNMHSTGHTVHPIDTGMGSGAVLANYNKYVASGNISATQADSYLSLVPYAQNSSDIATLKTNAKSNAATYTGPTDGDQVTCLSCHRAHASGFPEALRWQMEGEFIALLDGSGTVAWPGIDSSGDAAKTQFSRGRTQAETRAAYYDRPATKFVAYQRVLCNKCHIQD